MKKLFFTFTITFLILISNAYADTFNNTAFIGEWTSPNANDTNYTKLYIDYCDDSIINAHFKYVKNGEEQYKYVFYQGTVNDNQAEMSYDAYISEDTSKKPVQSGVVSLAWYVDNIWISMYSDNGDEVYSGMVVNNTEGFNPYASPFSYNVNIHLNGEPLEFDKKPAIINGTTYVPLRGTFDSMNINVYWDEFYSYNIHTQMITAAKGNEIIEIKRERTNKGNMPWYMNKWSSESPDTFSKNYTSIDIENTQPIIIEHSSYLPLRVIAESFGAEVQWHEETNTIDIIYDTSCDTKKSASEIAQIEDFTPNVAYNMVKSFYNTMNSTDYPYYTAKSKYYIFNCTRDGVNIVAKVDNSGNTLEYTKDEWNILNN